MHGYYHSLELFELGAVVSRAFHDAKSLNKLNPNRPPLIVTGHLKIPGKKM